MLNGTPMNIRNPNSIRPWQHVLEPLSGYLTLAEKMLASPSATWCEGWNFGPEAESERTVRELADLFLREWGSGNWTDVSDGNHPHEAGILRLKINKAKKELGWSPTWDFETMIQRTVYWYRQMNNISPCSLCMDDINAYCLLASE
jgi:CDP-glucose 4,6-dehydratase